MLDYYDRVRLLSEEKLMDEINDLNTKITKMMRNPNSAIYDQLMEMLEITQMAYHEAMLKRRIKTEDTVLNIGEIQSDVHQPDYSDEKLLDALVQGYVSTPKRNKNESN